MVIKSSVFWHITPRSPVKVNGVLEEHVSSISWSLLHAVFLLGSLFRPEDGGDIFI
jgi:hypothetical protein